MKPSPNQSRYYRVKSRKFNRFRKIKSKRIVKQFGGLNTIQLFIDELLKRYNTSSLPQDFAYNNTQQNYYYTQLVQILPCAARARDEIREKKRDLMRYKFNLDLTMKRKETLVQSENGFGRNDHIICSKLSDGEDGYQIIMGEFDHKHYHDCGTEVQLIFIDSAIRGEAGHALILLVNTETLAHTAYINGKPVYIQKTFSVIDPNGGGTLVDSLDDVSVSIMLESILNPYKNTSIEFPPCQRVSTFPDSCIVWSQLFTELILRFGLKNTKTYFDSLIKYTPSHQSVIAKRMSENTNFVKKVFETNSALNSIIKCYVIYIKSCIDNKKDNWIYPPEYIEANELRSKLFEVIGLISKLPKYTNKKAGEYIYLYIPNFYLITSDYGNWILYNISGSHTILKSQEFDPQYVATLFKNFPSYRKLLNYLNLQTITDNDLKILLRDKGHMRSDIVNLLFPDLRKGYVA
jgi:hypothetical protein